MQNVIDVVCYGSDGVTRLKQLTQWDIGQVVSIDNIFFKPVNTPEIHFCNRMSEECLSVMPTITDDKLFMKVPNSLLQEPYPIIGYVYLYDSSDINNVIAETVLRFKIPIKPRQKPSDYSYIENIDKISLSTVENKINKLYASYDAGAFQFQTGASAGSNIHTVKFAHEFSQTPIVVALTNQADSQNYSLSVTSKTPARANICVYNTEAAVNKTITVNWIAITT